MLRIAASSGPLWAAEIVTKNGIIRISAVVVIFIQHSLAQLMKNARDRTTPTNELWILNEPPAARIMPEWRLRSNGQTLPYRLRKVCRQSTQFPVAGLSRRDRLGFFGNNQDRPRIIFPDASRLVSQEAGLRNDLLIVYNCR